MNVSPVAYHEAGHAVACFVQRLPVTLISVDRWTGGGVDGLVQARGQDWWQLMVRVCLAGGVAERIALDGAEPTGDAQDLVEARALVAGVFADEAGRENILKKMHLQTVGLLTIADHWNAVEIVASALEDEKRFSGEDAKALIAEKQNDLTDEALGALQDRLTEMRGKLGQQIFS